MNLFELTQEYRNDVARLQDLDLPPEVVLDTIDGMQGEITNKIKAVIFVGTELKTEAQARIDCGKRMMESGQAQMNRAEGLFSYAQIAIQNSGLTLPIKYTEFTVNLQKNPPSCTVDDVDKLPPHMVTKTVEYSIKTNDPEAVIRAMSEAATASNINLGTPVIDLKVDKRVVLDALKTVDAVNAAKKVGEALDKLPGAHINPTGYRLTVR